MAALGTQQRVTRAKYAALGARLTVPAGSFPPTGVVGEVKPHRTDQIRLGVAQLRRRLQGSTPVQTLQLLTYQEIAGDPAWFVVRIADPDQLAAAVRTPDEVTRRTRADRLAFRVIGRVRLDPSATIPLRRCSTELGFALEPKVVALYQGWMRNVRGGAARGLAVPINRRGDPRADIRHEAADFLRELALELETSG